MEGTYINNSAHGTTWGLGLLAKAYFLSVLLTVIPKFVSLLLTTTVHGVNIRQSLSTANLIGKHAAQHGGHEGVHGLTS